MITDPNCNEPLDFTMPDCDDEVVSKDNPYQTYVDCEANQEYGQYHTPDEKSRYGYSTNEKSCSQTCRPMTCEEVARLKSEFTYRDGGENIPLNQVVNPDTEYEYSTDTDKCYGDIMCKTDYYQFSSDNCDTDFNELGEKCSNTRYGEHYAKCTPDCRSSSVSGSLIASHPYRLDNCPNPGGEQYNLTNSNTLCWTTCSCPDGMVKISKDQTPLENPCAASGQALIWTTPSEERPSYETTSGSIYCSNYDCGCPDGYKNDAGMYDNEAPTWTPAGKPPARVEVGGLKCVMDFCGQLGYVDQCDGNCLQCPYTEGVPCFCLN